MKHGHHKVHHITSSSHAGSSVSMATVSLVASDGVQVEGTGETRLHPDDQFDGAVAHDLALGRALVVLGSRMIKRAEGRMRMIEHNREKSRRARLKRDLGPTSGKWRNLFSKAHDR